MSFAIYEALNLLNDYKTVIALDVDMSIQAPIYELDNFSPYAMGYDLDLLSNSCFDLAHQFVGNLDKLSKYDLSANSYCSAVVVFQDTLKDYNKMHQWCYDATIEYAPHLFNPDQAILNLLIQEFNIDIKALDGRGYISFCYDNNGHHANIVHYATPRKVWNTSDIFQSFPEWYRVHLEWVKLGGTDISKEDLNFENVLLSYRKLIYKKSLSMKVKLFGFIPLIKNKYNKDKTKFTCFLFGFIPLFKAKL